MPVMIRCPNCGSQVQVITDGYVKAHADTAGAKCSFVKTASSPGGRPQSPEEKAARVQRIKEREQEATRKKREKAKAQAKANAKAKAKTPKQPKTPKPKKPLIVRSVVNGGAFGQGRR